jgi:hypothetical protein
MDYRIAEFVASLPTILVRCAALAAFALGSTICVAACHRGSSVADEDIERYFDSVSCRDQGFLPNPVGLMQLRDAAEQVGCAGEFDAYFRCRVESHVCDDDVCRDPKKVIFSCGDDPDSVCNDALAYVEHCGGARPILLAQLCGRYSSCQANCWLELTCEEVVEEPSALLVCLDACRDEL